MKNERVLIQQNEDLLNDIVQDLRFYKPHLQAVAIAFEGLHLGELTNEVFKDLTDNGMKNITARYKDGLEKELDAANVKNPILRKVALSESDTPLYQLESALSNLQSFSPPVSNYNSRPVLSLSSISLIKGVFGVSETDRENINEMHCRVYLENEAEKSLHTELNALKDALSTYLTKVNSLETGRSFSRISGLEAFLSIEGNDVQIKPEGIKWALSVGGRIRKMHEDQEASRRKAAEIQKEHQRKFDAGELPGQIAWRAANEQKNLVN